MPGVSTSELRILAPELSFEHKSAAAGVIRDVFHLPGAVLWHPCSAGLVLKGSKSIQLQLFVTPGHGHVYGPIFYQNHPHEGCFET